MNCTGSTQAIPSKSHSDIRVTLVCSFMGSNTVDISYTEIKTEVRILFHILIHVKSG